MPRRNTGPRLRFLDKRGVYYITWTERGRSRERSTGTADRGQAEIALAEFIHQRTRTEGPRDPAQTLVTDILADYAQERGPATGAPERIGYAVAPLTVFWEGRTVAEITKETCGRYVTTRGRAAGTARRELGVLRAAVNHAHGEGRLTRTVAVHLPEGAEPRERWWTREEAARLIAGALGYTMAPCSDVRTREEQWVICERERAYARLHLPLFIAMALYTGARKEAILSLRWSQIDLAAGRLNYNSPEARRSNKRRSRIPIPAKLLAHLRRARKRGTDIGFVIQENGARLGDIKKGFASACRRAGLTDVTPHTLRHTAATWLMQAGVAMWEASGYLGMTQETLERVYGHHHPDHLREASDAMSARPRNVRAAR
jgi:integrase